MSSIDESDVDVSSRTSQYEPITAIGPLGKAHDQHLLELGKMLVQWRRPLDSETYAKSAVEDILCKVVVGKMACGRRDY